jgi:protein SCO1/2
MKGDKDDGQGGFMPARHKLERRSGPTQCVAASLCLFIGGCSAQSRQTESQTQSPAQQQPAQQQRYDLKGKVVAIDATGKKLTVDHEAIPGFMGAMTMAYPVKDEKLLEHLSPGDQVTAKVVVASGGEYWLENIILASQAAPGK